MKIATFNVNSVRARLENICAWLREQDPDIVLLQEIKCQQHYFPLLELQTMGYESVVFGQKSYNGVAIVSKYPMQDVVCGLAYDDSDTQARYMEATIYGIRFANLYLPNGNPVDSEKFSYKLHWMERLERHIKTTLLPMEMPLVMGGDFNVIATDEDCYDPSHFCCDAAMAPQVRAKYRTYLNLGLTDAFSALNPTRKHAYTFWDYKQGAWQKNFGLRIDMFLANGYATDLMQNCWVDKKPRGTIKCSDHAPLMLELDSTPAKSLTFAKNTTLAKSP